MKRKILLSTSIVAIITGCSTDPALVEGGNEGYKTGFVHGCDSGATNNHPFYVYQKDIQRFTKDAAYYQGWNKGYAECKDSTIFQSTGMMKPRDIEEFPELGK